MLTQKAVGARQLSPETESQLLSIVLVSSVREVLCHHFKAKKDATIRGVTFCWNKPCFVTGTCRVLLFEYRPSPPAFLCNELCLKAKILVV